MAGRTEAEAVNNFLMPLHKAVDCVTNAVLDVGGGYHSSDKPHMLTFGDGGSVKLSGNPYLRLSIMQWYYVVEAAGARGPWRVSTASYYYTLHDSDDAEMISYHWHPESRGGVAYPHLHLGKAAKVGRNDLIDAHIPTGRIAIEDVLRLALTAFGVKPRRDDWQEILDQTQASYEEWRTWAGSGPANPKT